MSNGDEHPAPPVVLRGDLQAVPQRATGPRQRADAVRNRAQILSAAELLFTTHDPSTVTMEQIANAAGVGRATLYRSFPDPPSVATALLDEHERRLQGQMIYGPPPLGPEAPRRTPGRVLHRLPGPAPAASASRVGRGNRARPLRHRRLRVLAPPRAHPAHRQRSPGPRRARRHRPRPPGPAALPPSAQHPGHPPRAHRPSPRRVRPAPPGGLGPAGGSCDCVGVVSLARSWDGEISRMRSGSG